MISALQATDTLLGAFNNGFKAMTECIADRQRIQSLNYDLQLNEWRDYALRLENHNIQLLTHLNVMLKNYDVVQAQLQTVRKEYDEYVKALLIKIMELDDNMRRQSGNAQALNKMRERLIERLSEVADDETAKLLDPEEQKKMLEKDWDSFMKSNAIPPLRFPETPKALKA